MARKKPTKAESAHLDRVAALGCLCCDLLGQSQQQAEIHHVRAGQGGGERSSHWLTVPVCADCHRGPQGIHGDQTYLRILKFDELDLLAETLNRVYGRAA